MKANNERDKWYYELSHKIEAKEPGTICIPLDDLDKPTSLTEHEKYQVCCLCTAQLLTIGITVKEFEEVSKKSSLWKGRLFEYKGQRIKGQSSLHLMKCTFRSQRANKDNQELEQIIRLILMMLHTLDIPISYFNQVMRINRDWKQNFNRRSLSDKNGLKREKKLKK